MHSTASLKFSIRCTKISISTRKRWIYLLYVKRQETNRIGMCVCARAGCGWIVEYSIREMVFY